jgi:eukaryotic-like serine/threonine-protein kinase
MHDPHADPLRPADALPDSPATLPVSEMPTVAVTPAPDGRWSERLKYLMQYGLLNESTVESLIREVHTEVFRSRQPGSSTSPNGPVRLTGSRDRLFPVADWERYEFQSLLGQGGMGLVYKALDRRLNRTVALKFLRGDDEQMTQRFLQEARAQSRIDHPNVCKVYEVGEVEGMPYIAMQYIAGETLKVARFTLNLEQRVRMMRDVAEAVHAAHRLGIIHRDLKPANVLIERGETGEMKPVVMDFGLARDLKACDGLTETGMILGTPSYMSPEQAEGKMKHLDRRSDVYSLGAMFYELLVGKPPFEAETGLQVILKVVQEEPVSIRRLVPEIPPDLEAIAMKCLEKDLNRRYDSAQALATDLQRYLDGEPILAQHSTWRYRLLKKARKHRALVGVGAAALVGMLAVAAFAGYGQYVSREKERLAQQFGEDAYRIESELRFAYMSPLHDTRPQRERAKRQMDDIRTRMEQSGRLADGAGNYALGRGYLALYDYDNAKLHLEKARDAGFGGPGLDFALGRVAGEFFRRRLREADSLPDKSAREVCVRELEAQFLNPALKQLDAYCRSGASTQYGETLYVNGLIAYYRMDYDEALEKAREASRQLPWYAEAKKLEGDIFIAKGLQCYEKVDYDAAVEFYERADAAYREAGDISRSDVAIYEGMARRWANTLDARRFANRSFALERGKLVEAADRILEADPENALAFTMKCRAGWLTATSLVESPRIEDAAALKAEYEAAIFFGEQAIRCNSNDANAYNNLGMAYLVKAKHDGKQGRDARGTIERAIAVCEQSVKLSPRSFPFANNLAVAYGVMAQFRVNRGEDPEQAFAGAIANYRKVFELSPNNVILMGNIAAAYADKGHGELRFGKDPRTSLEQARVYYEKLVQLNPRRAEVPIALADIQGNLAKYALRAGHDPAAHLADGQRLLAQVEGGFSDPKVEMYRLSTVGHFETIAGQAAMRSGKSPEEHFTRAESALRAAGVGDSPAMLELTAELSRWEAEWHLKNRQSASGEIERGLAVIAKAGKFGTNSPELCAMRGALLCLRARTQRGPVRTRTAQAATEALEAAIRVNPMLRAECEAVLLEARSFGSA